MKESTKIGWMHFAMVAIPFVGITFLGTKVDGVGGYLMGVFWTFFALSLNAHYQDSERGRWKKDR